MSGSNVTSATNCTQPLWAKRRTHHTLTWEIYQETRITWIKSTSLSSWGKSNGFHLNWFGFGTSSSQLCVNKLRSIFLKGKCLTDGKMRYNQLWLFEIYIKRSKCETKWASPTFFGWFREVPWMLCQTIAQRTNCTDIFEAYSIDNIFNWNEVLLIMNVKLLTWACGSEFGQRGSSVANSLPKPLKYFIF